MYRCILFTYKALTKARDPPCRKMASDQESPVMTLGRYIFLRRLGMISALSRNKYVMRFLMRDTSSNTYFQFWEIKQNHFDTVAFCVFLLRFLN